MAKKIKTVDGAEGEVHPNGESETLVEGPWEESVEETDQAPEPAVDPFTQYINEQLHWFRQEAFGSQRGYHSASAVQSRGFLLLAELLIALEHRLGQIDHTLQKANNG